LFFGLVLGRVFGRALRFDAALWLGIGGLLLARLAVGGRSARSMPINSQN
jgi:hypothetical protein